MGVKTTRVVKYILKGDKGDDAVRYWLIPSVSSVSMANANGTDGIPTPNSVTCRVVKQVGSDTPTTITNLSNAGLTLTYKFIRSDGAVLPTLTYNGSISIPTSTINRALEFYLTQSGQIIDISTVAIVCDGKQGQPGLQGLQGEQGEQGEQGIPGTNGKDGLTSYFHIKYSDVDKPTTSAQMTETPSTYIGTYVDFVEADSNDPKRYTWYRFQGLQGEKGDQGIPGVGVDGKTTYLHIKYSNDGGKTFTADNGETPGDWIGYCTDFNLQDPTLVSAYTWSKIKGEKGENGVSYSIILSPSSVAVTADGLVICESDSINAKAYKNVGGVTSEAKDGSMKLYFTKADGTTSNVVATGLTAEGVSTYQAVWFEYSVNNKVVASEALVINREGQPGKDGTNGKDGKDGKDGDRGPALRGPQAWSDCAADYNFQSGAKGEAYKDVVLYQNNYYSCIKSHAKTASNYPGSTTDQTNKYWQLGDKVELIATKILLATYALVKNLGVEAIDMKDANGNILFQAKDGNVTCKTGTFENIKVSGDITAEYLNLKVSTANHYDSPVLANGSICVDADGIILPELPANTARSMRVLNPLITRSGTGNLILKAASNKVRISKTLSMLNAVAGPVTVSGGGHNSNAYFELLGIRLANNDTTYWLLSEMNNGIQNPDIS